MVCTSIGCEHTASVPIRGEKKNGQNGIEINERNLKWRIYIHIGNIIYIYTYIHVYVYGGKGYPVECCY